MTTPFTWSARLLDAAGNAAAGATLAVELFDLASNKWAALSQAVTAADGNVRGRGDIGDDTLPFAPALRLVEGGTVMATTPAIARAARGLNIDFGEVRRVLVAAPFVRTLGRGGSPFAIGGAAAATVDLATVRAEVSRDFGDRLAVREREVADRDLQLAEARRLVTDRETRLADTQRLVADREAKLADNVRVVGEKDAEIRRLSTVMAAKDQEIAALRQPRPAGPQVDAAAIRAEVTRDFSDRLAVREREVADRDSQISAREARLAESTRALEERDKEIRRLADVIADKDRIIAMPRPDRLAPETAASVTRVTDFASTIGVQLDDAQTALKSRGFSLGAIEVNARALLQDEGRKIEILDREAMKTIQPGVLSDLKFSFRPDKAAPEVTGQTVPDLMFLTESRARAVLASLGLLLEASTGPAGLNAQAAPGQAMLQTPAAGAGLPRGGRVHVIFAAAKE
ncbi:hypothetical protein IP88_07165 [alpha proteobacterium AAP81b]|nr:hypothetical protein IP88_07165 [alpha proteobacterium AAP81b]